MQIPTRRGRTFHLDVQDKASKLVFDATVHIKLDRCRDRIVVFHFSVIGISLKVLSKFNFSRVLNETAKNLLPEDVQAEFIKASAAHANRWKQKSNPIVSGGFLIRLGKQAESQFKKEVDNLRFTLEKSPEFVSAMEQVISRYFSAQDQQVLDYAKEYKWTNTKIRNCFFKLQSSIDGREVYTDDPRLYFDEVFGQGLWNFQFPGAKDVNAITFGIDPYPFVVCLCQLKSKCEIHAMAKIDGKSYERPLPVSFSAPEEQIEIAVMLTMTNAQRERNEAVPIEAKA